VSGTCLGTEHVVQEAMASSQAYEQVGAVGTEVHTSDAVLFLAEHGGRGGGEVDEFWGAVGGGVGGDVI
jgi:hypothetical protein